MPPCLRRPESPLSSPRCSPPTCALDRKADIGDLLKQLASEFSSLCDECNMLRGALNDGSPSAALIASDECTKLRKAVNDDKTPDGFCASVPIPGTERLRAIRFDSDASKKCSDNDASEDSDNVCNGEPESNRSVEDVEAPCIPTGTTDSTGYRKAITEITTLTDQSFIEDLEEMGYHHPLRSKTDHRLGLRKSTTKVAIGNNVLEDIEWCIRQHCTVVDHRGSETSSRSFNTTQFRPLSRPRQEIGEMIMFAVVMLNTLTMGISCDYGNSELWFVIDSLFLIVFFVERVWKYRAQGLTKYFCGQERGWNIFESILVCLNGLEVASATLDTDALSTSGFRVIRMVRVGKVVRIMRLPMFAELAMMVSGALGGVRTLCWSMVLIAFPLYAVAVILRESAGRLTEEWGGERSFDSLHMSFFTMFRCVVGGDCNQSQGKPIFLLLTQQGWGYALVYCITMVLMIFGFFNVIVAIYVENTVAAAKKNELKQKNRRMQDVDRMLKGFARLIDLVWTVQNGTRKATSYQEVMQFKISPEYFEELCGRQEFQDIMRHLEVSDEDQLDLFETLDVNCSGTLELEELVLGIRKLRGDPRRADVIGIGLGLFQLQQNMGMFERSMRRVLDARLSYIEQLLEKTT